MNQDHRKLPLRSMIWLKGMENHPVLRLSLNSPLFMIKAILIDDEAHCLDTLGILLLEYCPEVQVLNTCRSAKAGIEAIEKSKPDLVFLDIQMPGMDGFQLLEQLGNISFPIIFT